MDDAPNFYPVENSISHLSIGDRKAGVQRNQSLPAIQKMKSGR